MSRSSWKPFFIHLQPTFTEFNVQSRATMILPIIVGQMYEVYNGIRWFSIEVSNEIVGSSFGEFAPTRKRPIHTKVIKISKKIKK